MPDIANWKQQHIARMEANLTDVRANVRLVNAGMVQIPPHFKLVVSENGKQIQLVDTNAPSS